MPEWTKILIPSFVGMLTAVVAAYLSARWTTARAFQQRWWERKERAYSEIIDALYDMMHYCDLTASEYLNMNQTEDPERTKFRERYSEAYSKIQRAIGIGAFVISADAEGILTALLKRSKLDWNSNPPWEVYEEESRHFRDALVAIRQCAKRDLGVRKANKSE